MNQSRKENIDANVNLILKNCSVDEIELLGVLLTDVIQKSEDSRYDSCKTTLIEMLEDPDEKYFKGVENQFLSKVVCNKEELQYFVSQMQKSILKELENEKELFSDEDIEKLRYFFTIEALESYNANKQNTRIRKLIIALWCEGTVIFEECCGISKQLNELLLKLDEVLSKAVVVGDLIELLNDLQEYFDS